MDEQKLTQQIRDWLDRFHASAEHQAILRKVMTVGKTSKPWVEAIQRYVNDTSYQTPERGEIKRACRALLEQHG